MAKPKKSTNEASSPVDGDGSSGPRPRLHKLIVKNFRAIGKVPVEVELDDIVVLVGPNNVGKSSILRAYEVVMKQGSAEGKLQLDDFPGCVVSSDTPPEIELQTVVFDNAPGERWIATTDKGEKLVRERWSWRSPNVQPTRNGYDVKLGVWVDEVPWGAPNVAKTRRPLPHRIEAFASPEDQVAEITGILLAILREKIRDLKSSSGDQEKSDYELLLSQIAALQVSVVGAAREEMERIENAISDLVAKVFPKHRIKLDAKPETDLDKAFSPFKASPDILMGPEGGFMSKASQQGSGARRTLLWTALRYIAEQGDKDTRDGQARPHVLLLDEPEICLHPSAIREAREALYNLPTATNWQVMITTHSPVFIDLSKDNTTIVRIERAESDLVRGVTLFRPTKSQLGDDDKENLKALNACDPYVHEFFFGGRVVVVEGDTEFTAFSMVKAYFPDKYSDVQVVRARGKGTILTIIKILGQFSTAFAVLHDSDRPRIPRGRNPAWTMNRSIRDAIESSDSAGRASHVVSIVDFETAMFGSAAREDKPYNALSKLRSNAGLQTKTCELLDSLLDPKTTPPVGFARWSTISELEVLVNGV